MWHAQEQLPKSKLVEEACHEQEQQEVFFADLDFLLQFALIVFVFCCLPLGVLHWRKENVGHKLHIFGISTLVSEGNQLVGKLRRRMKS